MSPENNTETPGEPVTPELDTNANSNPVEQKFVLPPTAPKGKPRAPPLIHGKIKLNEEDDISEMSGGSGSKIPLLKTKHFDLEHAEGRKRFTTLSGNHNGSSMNRDSKLSKSTVECHRTVEKVKLPKGIEMRRVVQESNGIKTKRYSSAVRNSKATLALAASAKESSQGSSSGIHRRKMTKVEASFPEVKSFNGHVHKRPTGSGPSLRCKSKSDEAIKPVGSGSDVNKQHVPDKEKKPDVSSSKTTIKSVPETSINNTAVKIVAEPEAKTSTDNFKTVDEFLNMPETSLPESKARSPVKKTIYKSKFWDYIDPKTSSKRSKCSSKEQKKPYDPDAVKNFMQKQKEMRKIQQMKESKDREAESVKRQRMLKELDSKCQKIALKGKLLRETGEGVNPVNSEDIKKPKLETPSQSPSMKYLKPLLERKQGSLFRKSDSYTRDVAKQSQYLLAEFENIVKRECISFLQKIPIPSSQTNIDSAVEKVDKAVATSISLLDLSGGDSEKKHQSLSQSDDVMEVESLENDDYKHPSIPSLSTVENAARKIQSCYRGYKVRQALKEAKIFYCKPAYKRRSDILRHNAAADKLSGASTNRRWSFPRNPEKPYDNLSRLQPMSPVLIVGRSSEFSMPFYIPPPPVGGQTPRSPSRPRVLPFPLTPGRVYNEPYPKVTRKSTEVLDRTNSVTDLPAQLNESIPSLQQMASVDSRFQHAKDQPAESSKQFGPMNSANYGFEFAVPASLPSIIDVLREKLRLFSSESNNDLLPATNAVPTSPGVLYKDANKNISNEHSLKQTLSGDRGSRKIVGKESGDLSTTTNDDYVASQDDGITPKIKKHKRRSRLRAQRSHGDSSTTVETDGEYVPSATRSSMAVSQQQRNHSHASTSGSKSEETMRSSTLEDPTTTSSFENYLAPALQLRYEAEREHLKIIEKALQVRLHGNIGAAESTESVQNNEQLHQSGSQEAVKKTSPQTDRVQLAIANCQKESMKAAAEMAKWMSEFQKTTREQDRVQAQQPSVDLAATVIAAVEQARVIGIEKRKGKRLQEQNKQSLQRSKHPTKNQSVIPSESESQISSETISKADKCVETSLILVKDSEKKIERKEKSRDFVENNIVHKKLKDYQQQFPSESERDSPVPIVQTLPNCIAPPTVQHFINETSRQSSVEDGASRFQDPIDYPSIIPSGNSVDFTSLDPKVSSLDCISQIESEKEGTFGEASVEDDINEQYSCIQDQSQPASLEHSASGVISDSVSHHTTIVDEAVSCEQSNFLNDVSNNESSVEQVMSDYSDVAKSVSFQSSMKVENEASQSEIRVISTESKIEELISEQSDLVETESISQQSRIEEDILNSNYSQVEDDGVVPYEVAEDLSRHSNIDPTPHESEIQEEISKQSYIEDNASSHGTINAEIPQQEASKQPEFIEKVSIKDSHEEDKSDHFETEENTSDEQLEIVEDKATETELPDDIESTSDKDASRSEMMNVQSDQISGQSIAENETQQHNMSSSENKCTQGQDIPNIDALIPSINEVPHSFLEKLQGADNENEIPVIEDVADNESQNERELSGDAKFSNENEQLQVLSPNSSVIEDIAESESKFEEDVVTEQSQIVEGNVSVTVEGYKSPPAYEESPKPMSTIDKLISDSSYAAEDTQAKTTRKPPPPPPYSPPSSLKEIDLQISETSVPSLEVSSGSSVETNENATTLNMRNATEDVGPKTGIEERLPASSEHASLNENHSEKSQFEEDISEEKSQILDEASNKSNREDEVQLRGYSETLEFDKSEEPQNKSEIRTLEMETKPQSQETQDTVSKPEFEIPLKPPPPYSPSSSLDSTSLSSRSLIVSLADDKLEKIAREQANIIWDVWKSGKDDSDSFPDVKTVMNVMYEKNLVKESSEAGESHTHTSLQSSAEHSFDVLMCHLIYETMKEVLQVRNNVTSFIERVRPGPLSLQAQKLKIPKTCDALVVSVLNRVGKIIPPGFSSEPHAIEKEKPRLRKWCSRPRELVDEILLEELVEEDYQWTEWWPEEVIITHHISTKIIQTLIRNALDKRKYVFSQ